MEVTSTVPKNQIPVTITLDPREARMLKAILQSQVENGPYYLDGFAAEFVSELTAVGVTEFQEGE